MTSFLFLGEYSFNVNKTIKSTLIQLLYESVCSFIFLNALLNTDIEPENKALFVLCVFEMCVFVLI